jgi:transposase InsO family protein
MFYDHEYEFKTLEELKEAMEKYIHYYNNNRIHQKLKDRTPCEVRNSALEYV